MDSFSLQTFGVGDGLACADRYHSSCLYRFGRTSILIDCGEPVSGSLRAAGFSAETVDQILLSHLHSDHLGGLFMLLQGFWLDRRRKPLPIHLPADGIEPLKKILRAAYLFDELFKFRLSFQPLQAGRAVQPGAVRVTPFRTTHLDRLRRTFQGRYPGDYAAYSFLIEAGRWRIAHSADLGAVEDLEPLLVKPVDLLVCELAHFTPRRLFSFLQGRAIGRMLFTHLGRRSWEDLAETRRLARRMLPGAKFSFPRDRQAFTFC